MVEIQSVILQIQNQLNVVHFPSGVKGDYKYDEEREVLGWGVFLLQYSPLVKI